MNKLSVLLVCVLSYISMPVCAEQKQTYGEYEVHYVVFNSTFLEPSIANQYSINRSDKEAIVNVSILKKSKDLTALASAVEADLSGEVRNLVGQIKPLSFRQVKEENAIYYLASFRFSQEETLSFDVQIDLPNNAVFDLKFSKKMYTEQK